jgi:hypothetical protein
MVDPRQVGPDGFSAETDVEKVVPEQDELAAKLRDVAVRHLQELLLGVDGLLTNRSIREGEELDP